MKQQADQMDLLEDVLNAYAAADRPVTNGYLYKAVAQRAHLDGDTTGKVEPIGQASAPRNVFHRRLRWHQQTLKAMGLLQRVPDKRGVWQLTDKARKGLHPIRRPFSLIAFSTDLGVALWSHGSDIFGNWPTEQQIMLSFSSPPYPLANARRYGNPDQKTIVSFILESLAPIVERMAPEGSLVLNVSSDIFLHKQPARSTYVERLVIGIEDELGLALMDRIPWVNRSKSPGPMLYASGTRQQLNVSWEPILWFAKDPLRCKADNRRVLEPHSDRHKALIAQGGEQRTTHYGDGAYRVRPGSFKGDTPGRIPKNVLETGHACAWGQAHRKACKLAGLPTHGAGMPFRVPEFFIKFLTEENDLVADFWGGRSMTGRAAESNGRRWVTTENILEYAAGASLLFSDAKGFKPGGLLDALQH